MQDIQDKMKVEGSLAVWFSSPELYEEWKKQEELKQAFFMSLFENKEQQ